MKRMEARLGLVAEGVEQLLNNTEEQAFEYEPYLTRKAVDTLDKGQALENLGTDLEKNVYKKDDEDLLRNFAERKDKKKCDWIVNCVLHRRKASSGPIRKTSQAAIITRINDYVRRRKRIKRRKGVSGKKRQTENLAKMIKNEPNDSDDLEEEERERDLRNNLTPTDLSESE
ncbi:hypothetical protein PFISCL1PPCAC_15596 [Pristionchus fissidentatus]|uniref:Uncharacterized protein n=1 Tax=Pristionchus fissidentatus TaxID=1538716 RepID=A0AAV5W0S0_9BILA|nr:hypothetical protein PFISCL1PPCAC_15596 [Pristionchus fissidentatus]